MRVLHLINIRFIQNDQRKQIQTLKDHLKKSDVKSSTIRRFIISRYLLTRMLWGRYSIINLHEPGFLILLSVNLLGKFENTPIILSVYSNRYLENGWQKRFKNALFNKIIRKSRIILFSNVCVFDAYKKKYKKYSSKFFLIERGIESAKREDYLDQLKITNTYVIKNDRSAGFKDTRTVLEGFSYNPKNYKIMLCDKYAEDQKSIESTLKNFNLHRSTEFSDESDSGDVLIDLMKPDLSKDTLFYLSKGKCVIGLRKDIRIDGYTPLDNVSSKKISQLVTQMNSSCVLTDVDTFNKYFSWDARANQYKILYEMVVKHQI